jgi:hypothetical protein
MLRNGNTLLQGKIDRKKLLFFGGQLLGNAHQGYWQQQGTAKRV